MDKTQQRIKIAEACGWRCIQDSEYAPFGVPYKVGLNPSGGENFQKIPDYLNDLNAMHEAEKALTFDQYHITFLPMLQRICERAWIGGDHTGKQSAAHGTASQRAEAFLRTLGLWKNE